MIAFTQVNDTLAVGSYQGWNVTRRLNMNMIYNQDLCYNFSFVATKFYESIHAHSETQLMQLIDKKQQLNLF